MTLKEQIGKELDVFLNLDEFADIHEISGREVPAIVDKDILKIRIDRRDERYDGIYKGEVVVYMKTADLPFRPVYGQDMTLDGEDYLVKDSSEEMGVLVITLEANEA